MPIFLKKTLDTLGKVAIWKIEEPLSFFEKKCKISTEEQVQLKDLKGKKKLEWYASRYLLQFIHKKDENIVCVKDEHGKPFLKDSSHFISLSHSNEMTAVISSELVVGIDIQKIVPKIDRISKKFISSEEEKFLGYNHRLEEMHLIWGAKESLYKSYGKRSLDFKKHLFVSEFDYKPEGCSFKGLVIKDGKAMEFSCWAGKIENYMLVYAVKN